MANAGFGRLLRLGRLSESDELDDDRLLILVSTTSEGAQVYDQKGELIDDASGLEANRHSKSTFARCPMGVGSYGNGWRFAP